jgi:hypothetical protein
MLVTEKKLKFVAQCIRLGEPEMERPIDGWEGGTGTAEDDRQMGDRTGTRVDRKV